MKIKIIGTILTIVATIIGLFVLPELTWQNTGIAILGGLAVGIFTHTFQLIDHFQEHTKSTNETLDQNINRIVEILKVHNDYYNDTWLFKLLKDVVETIKFASTNPHQLEKVKDLFNKAIMESMIIVKNKYWNDDIEHGEVGRIVLLNEATTNATKYIYAVSYDIDGYIDNFFHKVNDQYVNANINAAKNRNVIIKRIFILDDQVHNMKNNPTNKKVKAIISNLKKGGSNIHNYILLKSNIQPELRNYKTSFYVCDDIIASESETENTKSYYSMNDIEIINKLKNRFEAYLLNADKQ